MCPIRRLSSRMNPGVKTSQRPIDLIRWIGDQGKESGNTSLLKARIKGQVK